jgi:hypothetical protein
MFKAFLRFDAGGKLIAVSAMLLVIIMVKPFLKNDSGNARLYQDACVRAQTVAGMEHNAAEAKLDEIAVEESQKAILESSDPVALQTKLDKEKNIGFILDGNLYTLQKAQEYIDNAKYGTGITHDVPSERYYDNLDAYKRLDTPSLVINEVWDSYYNITGFDLTAVTALLIAALGFLRSFELGTDKCEVITANGSKTTRLRFWFWFVLTVVITVISFAADVVISDVMMSGDLFSLMIQGIKKFTTCFTELSLGNYLVCSLAFRIMTAVNMFCIFFIIAKAARDTYRYFTISLGILMLSAVLKATVPSVSCFLPLGFADIDTHILNAVWLGGYDSLWLHMAVTVILTVMLAVFTAVSSDKIR